MGIIDAIGTHFYDTTQNHVYEEFDKSLTRQKENYMPLGVFQTDGPVKRKAKPGMTIGFYHCSNVVIKDITIKDTPEWALRIAYSDDIIVSGISIKNNLMVPNSDGIHFTTSRNARVSNCEIRAGDDAFIITGFTTKENTPGYSMELQNSKTFGNKTAFAENIVVSNCLFQSRSSGIRVGYGQHPIRNCIFNNIIIYESNRGIGVFAHDASAITNILFSDIVITTRLHNGQWWGNGEPIHLSAINRFENEPTGNIENVQFKNITATSEHGILLYGNKYNSIKDITLDNIKLKLVKGKETLTYGGNIDLRPAAEINKQMFEHDIPGIYTFQVSDLKIKDFEMKWGDKLPAFYTYAIELEKVEQVKISNFRGDSNPASNLENAVKMTDTKIE